MGQLEFMGRSFLDGQDSDPERIGWMQGSPPPEAMRIRFEDDDFLSFPKIRWALSHVRELLPTVGVARGNAPATDLGLAHVGEEEGIDRLRFTDMFGRDRVWAEALHDSYTDGILVLHRGRRVYERYFGALRPDRLHACFSITKSYVATLAAMMVRAGDLDETRLIPHYLPEMAGTAYHDATLRQVMDMLIGVDYSEDYANPHAQIWDYSRAAGMRPRRVGDTGADHLYEFLTQLQADGAHGQAFAYKTVNTEVLAWVLRRTSGEDLADMLARCFWRRLGCEQDASLSVDPLGVPMGGGGLSASLRDNARFGDMLRCQGHYNGQQIVDEAIVADIARGGDPAHFAKAGYSLLPGYSYRNMWWVTHNEHDAFEARGIHGQRIYIAPKADLVISRFCSHPIAASAGGDPITIPAFLALGRALRA